jgi:hypothetical protein
LPIMEIRPANQISEKFLFRNIVNMIFFLRELKDVCMGLHIYSKRGSVNRLHRQG